MGEIKKMDNYIIETKNVYKRYGKFTAVSDLNLQLKKGRVYGLIGPNGAGKTSIMKILAGISLPSKGQILLNGHKMESELAIQRKKMSFMIETPYVKMNLSAWRNLEMQRIQKGIKDKKRIEEVMQTVGLSDVGNKSVKHFSLGMRQRLGLANALMVHPELMVLDEPVNGLDPDGMIEIRNLIVNFNKKNDITIVISSHILSELSQMCTDYIFVQNGKIIKTMSAEDMVNSNRAYYSILTDDNEKFIKLLGEKLNCINFKIRENQYIQLFDYIEEPLFISKFIVENGLYPIHFSLERGNLEEFYMSIMEEENVCAK